MSKALAVGVARCAACQVTGREEGEVRRRALPARLSRI